jgi:hypothetical protein
MKYDYDCRLTNGISWNRGLGDWGWWLVDRRAKDYNPGNTPIEALLVLRLPRYTVAILHPVGQRG